MAGNDVVPAQLPGESNENFPPTPRPDPREGYGEVKSAYGDLRKTPPVTVLEDVVGRFSQSKGQDNALRDAIRQKATDTIRKYQK